MRLEKFLTSNLVLNLGWLGLNFIGCYSKQVDLNCDRFKRDVYQLQDENTDLRLENVELRDNWNETKIEMESMKGKMVQLDQKVGKLEGELSQVNNNIDKIVDEKVRLYVAEMKNEFFSKFEKTNDNINVHNNNILQNARDIKKVEDDLEEDFEKLEDLVEEIEEKIESFVDENQIEGVISQADLDTFKTEVNEKVENISQEVASLDEKYDNKYVKIKTPNMPLCVAQGLHAITTDKKVGKSFTLYPSYRLSFILQLTSTPGKGHHSIFSISDAINDSDYNRAPQLTINGSAFHIKSNRCNGYTDSWETQSDIQYKFNLKLHQNYALTIEYIREINQLIFYINGVIQVPFEKEYSRIFPGAVCYGIDGQLMISERHHVARAKGFVQNFVYEQNVSGKPLGGYLISDT